MTFKLCDWCGDVAEECDCGLRLCVECFQAHACGKDDVPARPREDRICIHCARLVNLADARALMACPHEDCDGAWWDMFRVDAATCEYFGVGVPSDASAPPSATETGDHRESRVA